MFFIQTGRPRATLCVWGLYCTTVMHRTLRSMHRRCCVYTWHISVQRNTIWYTKVHLLTGNHAYNALSRCLTFPIPSAFAARFVPPSTE